MDSTWTELVKNLKKEAVEKTERGDLPPTIITKTDDQITSVIESPEVDKRFGYLAIDVLRKFVPFDAVSLVLDAHIAVQTDKNMSPDEFLQQYPPGSMQQQCDEEGACERGLITDVMMLNRFTSDQIDYLIVPYSYHGKGSKFNWLDEEPRYQPLKESAASLGGAAIETITAILQQPVWANAPNVAVTVLTEMGFKVRQQNFSQSADNSVPQSA